MALNLFEDASAFSAYKDIRHLRGKKLGKFIKDLEENGDIEEDYKTVVLHILNEKKKNENREYSYPIIRDGNGSTSQKRKDIDNDVYCSGEAKMDPVYVNFLKHLRPHDKSYILEYERDGSTVVIKYESTLHEVGMPPASLKKTNLAGNLKKVKLKGDSFMGTPTLNTLKKRDQRKLILDITQEGESSNGRPMRSDREIKKVEIGKSKSESDRDFETKTRQKTRYEACSDVEILNSDACFDKGLASPSVLPKEIHDIEKCVPTAACVKFRRQVLDYLKRPYNKEEYVRLRNMVEVGSYFDSFPDLKSKLTKYRHKQGKRLTIFRGFIFWLQYLPQKGSFKPWKDRECLAVEPPHP